MKDKVMKYKKYELEKVKESMSNKDKQILQDFKNKILVTNNHKTAEEKTKHIVQFYDTSEIPLSQKPTIQERDNYLACLNNSEYSDTYKRDVRVYLKKFLKWKWRDMDLLEEFPKLGDNTAEQKTEDDLIEPKEVKQLLTTEKNSMWRALISLFYITGQRPETILKLAWRDIHFIDEDLTDIQLRVKKNVKKQYKKSIFPVNKGTTGFLRELKNSNSNAQPNDYVFTKDGGKTHITGDGFNKHLKKLAKDCGITKRIYPYLFRYTRGSILYDNTKCPLDDRNVAQLMNHSPQMAHIYHITSQATARQQLITEVYNAKKKLTPTEEADYKKEIADLRKEMREQEERLKAEVRRSVKLWLKQPLTKEEIKKDREQDALVYSQLKTPTNKYNA